MPSPPSTLPELLESAARRRPERGIRIFDSRGRRSTRRTFPAVLAAAQASARRLAGRGLEPGAVVLLSLDTSWELLDAWFGTMLVGALPVVIAPPVGMGLGAAHMQKLDATLERLEAALFVCGEGWRQSAEREGFDRLLARATTPEELAALSERADWCAPKIDTEDIAFLQLTSGSTGLQRGVQISHGAVLANVRSILDALSTACGEDIETYNESTVSWLPLHHDMGLVGVLLTAIHAAFEITLLPPRAFLSRPLTWLHLLESAGRTTTAAPNFAYHACVERYDEKALEGLDLSGWHTALVGAEMVRPDTLESFASCYERHGFSANAVLPCYGMAEATLGVTLDTGRRGVRSAPVPDGADTGERQEVACVGTPVLGTEIIIAGASGESLGDDLVGEVRVRAPSLFSGYWNDREATDEALVDGWLHTGDLGFLRAGELYITGRIKDLLILRGHNLMPHELEWCAESASGGGGNTRTGAFSIPGPEGEEAVLAVEVASREPAALVDFERAIRLEVGDRLGLTLADLVFVRRGRLPKTTSGKVQRRELRRRYLAGELDRLEA